MGSRFNYEDLMCLHTILHDDHALSGLHNLIASCTFSERKLRVALDHLYFKPDKKEEQQGSTFSNLFLNVSPLKTEQAVNERWRQNAEFLRKVLYEYEYEDLPLLINDKELNGFQLTVYRWRLKIGK